MKVSKDFLSTSHFKEHSLNVGDIDNEYSISSVVCRAKIIDTRKKYRYFEAIRYFSYGHWEEKAVCVEIVFIYKGKSFRTQYYIVLDWRKFIFLFKNLFVYVYNRASYCYPVSSAFFWMITLIKAGTCHWWMVKFTLMKTACHRKLRFSQYIFSNNLE